MTNAKMQVALPVHLITELAALKETRWDGESPELVEEAVRYYIAALHKRERDQRDIEIINANADRFNREAEENLAYQVEI